MISGSGQSTAAAQLRFVAVGPDDPLAQPLLAELAVEYAERYGGTPETHLSWLPVPPAELAPPDGGLLIGLLDGVPVTGGAFRRFDADTVEFKRIWTDSGCRRRGYAKALLDELEATAASRGYRRAVSHHRQPPTGGRGDVSHHRIHRDRRAVVSVVGGPFHAIAFVKGLP